MKKLYKATFYFSFLTTSKIFFIETHGYKSDIPVTENHVFLADTKYEALKLAEKYYVQYKETIEWQAIGADALWHGFEYKVNRNWAEVYEVNATLNYLKENMWSQDFLEYCKQELYPIETIIKG
jgi:hypothetical protein